MNTPVEVLKSRWRPEWNGNPSLAPLSRGLTFALHVIETLPKFRAAKAESGTLSEKGLNEEVRTKAAQLVPELRRASWEAEKTSNGLKSERARLAVPAPDKTDIAGALLRQEIRAHLRSMPIGAQVEAVMSDPAFLQAAMEGPAALSGLTDQLRTDLEQRMIEQAFPEATAAMAETREAVTLLESAIAVAVATVAREAQLQPDSPLFDAWMRNASADVEREIAAQKQKAEPKQSNAERLTQPAPVEPSAAGAAVAEEIDRLFAEAFPTILNKAA